MSQKEEMFQMTSEKPKKLEWNTTQRDDPWRNPQTNLIKAKLLTTTVIPLKTSVISPSLLSQSTPDETTLYLQQWDDQQFIVIAPTVTDYKREMPLTIHNPTNEAIRVPCETVVAYFDAITDINSMISASTPKVYNLV